MVLCNVYIPDSEKKKKQDTKPKSWSKPRND